MSANLGLLERIAPAENDPPVFILLASPSWAPWLPDTAYQKIPIGVSGQVLTVQSDGSVNWSNSASGFANPMTTSQDLIVGGTGGSPTRLPIGSNGQVLTDVSGTITWANPVTGFANPMTTQYDLIVGGTGGSATRLGAGSPGQALVMQNITGPQWSSALLTNPMTTAGDIIVAGAGAIPTRLGLGLTGYVLTSLGSGNLAWQALPSSFANPMTTTGDIITATTGGSAVRLAAGTSGQVLTANGAAAQPTWQNNPAGFANPMTTPQDMIVGGVGGAGTRLPVGTNGQVLTVAGGAVQWLPAGATLTSTVVLPSGDTTGATDVANITTAFNALVATGLGGKVQLGPGNYWINNQITIPAQSTTGNQSVGPCSLEGVYGATQINTVAAWPAGTAALYCHRTTQTGLTNQNGQPNPMLLGSLIRNIVINGRLASAANIQQIGLDCGDQWGLGVENVMIKDFYTTSVTQATQSIGLYFAARLTWAEKCHFDIHTINCDQHVVRDNIIGNPGNSNSQEYNDWRCYMYALGGGHTVSGIGQQGMTFLNGAYQGGGSISIRGNFGGGGTAGGSVFIIGGGPNDGGSNYGNSNIFNCHLDVDVESAATSGWPTLVTLNASINSMAGFGQLIGQFDNWSASALNGGQFNVIGHIAESVQGAGHTPYGGSTLNTPPSFALASSGVGVNFATYRGIDCIGWITGGSVSALTLNGNSYPPGQVFYVRDKMIFSATYTGSPVVNLIGLDGGRT